MSERKGRLTVTVDRQLIQAGNEAVAAGRAESMSGWVNLAMAERLARERRLQAMAEALTLYEAESGTISAAELVAQDLADRRAARIVRGPRRTKPRSARRRAS